MNPPARCIVLLNDTRSEGHFGCQHVVANLLSGLAAEGIGVSASAPVGAKWWRDTRIIAALEQADGIVINGEGTLHHGQRRGERLLQIVDHPAAAQRPAFLVNALYQENPPSWSGWLKRFNAVYARDRHSAAALSASLERPVEMVPDLSLSGGFIVQGTQTRRGVLISDSVDRTFAQTLAQASSAPGRRLTPILPHLRAIKGRTQLARLQRTLNTAAREAMFRRRYPNARFAKSANEFTALLQTAQLHATGRFHGVCLSLLTKTPFVAFASNSWKIESLLDEMPPLPARLADIADLESILDDPGRWRFSHEEETAIDSFLSTARAKAKAMFSTIASRL